jgi:Rap1a immunity proteins
MRTATATFLAMLVGSTTAMAQAPGDRGGPSAESMVTHVETVRDLAAVCDPAWGGMPRLEAIAYCQGFLTSAGQYHALMYPQGGPLRPLFCASERRATIAESGVAFATWARQTPQYANEPALDGFLRWAQARFPCPPAARGAGMRNPR